MTINSEMLENIEQHYARMPQENGFASKCSMTVAVDVSGKSVLDLCCRRGKGVFKLSELVGEKGFVIGVDPSLENINVAKDKTESALIKSGLSKNNMSFRVGFPEDLETAGVEPSSVDVVFINSVLNLTHNISLVLQEASKVLSEQGILVIDGVIADRERDMRIVEAARTLGNSIQSAISRNDLSKYLLQAGFSKVEYTDEFELDPKEASTKDQSSPLVSSEEDVLFIKTVVVATK